MAILAHSLSDSRGFVNCKKRGIKKELHKLARQIIYKNAGFFSHPYHWSWYYQSFIYSPTDALVSCLKNNIKIYIKILVFFVYMYTVAFNNISGIFVGFQMSNKICLCIFSHIRTVHLDIIKVLFIQQLMRQWVVLKTILKFILKFTLKHLRHVSVLQLHHHQGAH